uniref:Uncharacterized protein n=1 Tax=Arundo donax TaxID=35708 RepID=A0A0A9HJY9_ARUDO
MYNGILTKSPDCMRNSFTYTQIRTKVKGFATVFSSLSNGKYK